MDDIKFIQTLIAVCDVGIVALTCLGIVCAVKLLQHIGVI